ncbi:hypothetical protein ASE86_11845 [Sphingomonas sp. Leaf33]|uniref:hypothetical protein n=1 Tax=Sphingomonas sp. Leaf33 TaxID=1736215 RepID=UPI0006F85CDE|nr:hypothetical protein [Sphingomonas sp. Leaf33]KQN19211.1 hypothetical protein ASE86_11845 [Sphingomonas sp. Leaf33]
MNERETSDYDHQSRVTSTRDVSLTGQVWVFKPYQNPGDPYYLHDPDRGEWVQRQAYYTGLRQESFGYAADGQLTNVAIVETGYTDDGNGNAVSTNVLDRRG